MAKALVLNQDGLPCPKCRKAMETRTHKRIGAKQLGQPYYFSQWYLCKRCGHVQHVEKYKVFNRRPEISAAEWREDAVRERVEAISAQLGERPPWED